MYYFYDSYGNLAKIYRHTSSTTKKIYNVVTNAQGDVTAIYDFYGVLVCTYEYDAWGNLNYARDSAGNIITSQNHIAYLNPIRYRGYYFDNEIGMYYLQSRYYDPNTGRFINADGYITTGQGVLSYNMYAYCMNNPVMYSDPSGEWPDWLDDKIAEVETCVSKSLNNLFGVEFANYVSREHISETVGGFNLGWPFGRVEMTTTVTEENKTPGFIYAFTDAGNDCSEAGIGLGNKSFVEVGVSTKGHLFLRIGEKENAILPGIHVGVSLGIDGIGFNAGLESDDISQEVDINVGWLAILFFAFASQNSGETSNGPVYA